LGVDLAPQKAQGSGQRQPHVRPEIDDHRRQRAQMRRHVDDQPLIGQARQTWQQDQMA